MHLEIFLMRWIFCIPVLVGGYFCKINWHIVKVATRSKGVKYAPLEFNVYGDHQGHHYQI